MSLAWPAVVQLLVFIYSGTQQNQPCVLVFIIVINLIFLCFRYDALTELGAFMRTNFSCISVFRVASGPRVNLASCKSALNPSPTPLHPAPRWLILLTVLRRWSRCQSYSLLLCGLFYEMICFKFCLVLLCSCVFQSPEHCDYLAQGRES